MGRRREDTVIQKVRETRDTQSQREKERETYREKENERKKDKG
jgi:hypothetical protein